MGEQKIQSESSPKSELKSSSLDNKDIGASNEQKESKELKNKLVAEIITASLSFSSERQEQFQDLLKGNECSDIELQKLQTILLDLSQKKIIDDLTYENGWPSNIADLRKLLNNFNISSKEKSAEEKTKTTEEKTKTAEEKTKTAEEKTKTAEGLNKELLQKKLERLKELNNLNGILEKHPDVLKGHEEEWIKYQEAAKDGRADTQKCHEFALGILSNLDAKAQATKDPEQRKKLYADISSVATTFCDLGTINDTELNVFLGAVDKNLKTSTDVGTKVAVNEGFEKRGTDYIKTVGNTSDILGFDEKGAPKEKIMSGESGFVIDVPVKPEHAFIRDMEMLGSKITETTSQLKQVEQYSKELELLKSKSARTENEEKKMQQLESINLQAVKERLTKRLETLQERMKKYEKEAQSKPNEMEQYEKTKESQRKKVEFYDAIGLTRFGNHAESLVKTIGQLSDDIFPPKIGDSVGSDRKEQEHFLKVFGLMLGKEGEKLSFDMNAIPPVMKDKFLKTTPDLQDMLIKRGILIGEKGGDTKMTSYELIKQKLLQEAIK